MRTCTERSLEQRQLCKAASSHRRPLLHCSGNSNSVNLVGQCRCRQVLSELQSEGLGWICRLMSEYKAHVIASQRINLRGRQVETLDPAVFICDGQILLFCPSPAIPLDVLIIYIYYNTYIYKESPFHFAAMLRGCISQTASSCLQLGVKNDLLKLHGHGGAGA